MAKLLRLRRGTDTQHSSFTGAEGEVTVNTTNDSLHVHDGATAGGTELAKADLSNVDGSLSNNLGFADNTKALFGTGNDLEIYHNGSDSVISDLGTGDLYIKSSSTFIRTGTNESMANFNADGSVQLYHDNSQKLATTSTGINVTGSVECDGLTCDGAATVRSTIGQIEIHDTNNTGADSECLIRARDSNSNSLWYYGTGGGATDVYVWNYQNGAMQFATNNVMRAQFTSAGHFVPGADNTYDLGSTGAEWRNGYFDGTVNCDGLNCDGNAVITASTGNLDLKDGDNTGGDTSNHIRGLDSAGAVKWYVGDPDGNADLFVNNVQAGDVQIAANNTSYLFIQTDGHVRPATNNSQDLGTSSLRWRNVYTNDLNLSNEGGANDVDGTWGNWTIQEGEDDLFLLNRRNGKKYKFNLSEVN